MEKILIPIDGSDRSLQTIRKLKKDYAPGEVDVTLLMVVDGALHFKYDNEYEAYLNKRQKELNAFGNYLEGYTVHPVVLHGSPGSTIVEYAENNHFDVLMMTRSSRGSLDKIGSVATYIVRRAPFVDLVILREEKDAHHEDHSEGGHENRYM